MVKLDEYIKGEFKKLDRGIIATPQNREYLESFAKANQGSMDILLMQMGINYGYKIALENIEEEINKLNTITDR
jgi:hypothetical protein